MFDSRLGFSGLADRMPLFVAQQNPSWWPMAILVHKNRYNFATGLPIGMMFGYIVGFSGSADLMVQLSMTSNDLNPSFDVTV